MPTRRRLTSTEREQIVRWVGEGKTHGEVAGLLGIERPTVSGCWARFRQRKTFEDAPRSGRPHKTSKRMDRIIKRISQATPAKNAVEIRAEIEEAHGVNVCASTVQKRLCEEGLHGRRPAKKPIGFGQEPARPGRV